MRCSLWTTIQKRRRTTRISEGMTISPNFARHATEAFAERLLFLVLVGTGVNPAYFDLGALGRIIPILYEPTKGDFGQLESVEELLNYFGKAGSRANLS